MKYLKYVFLVIYIFITIIIFYKAFENNEQSTESSDKVTDTIVDAIDQITPGEESITNKVDIEDIKLWVRKGIGHFGVFALLGVFTTLTYYLFIMKRNLSIIITLLSGLFTAIISECIQLFSEGRVGSFIDVILDFGGFIITFLITEVIIILFEKYQKKKVVSI
jgi:VanZ family protein